MDDSRTVEALEELDIRLRTLLPTEYQQSYEELQPTPMRSAGLKYAADGSVAWDEIWDGFCDLAMAGGPPHRGALLSPGTRAAIDSHPDRYQSVVEEICRGVVMATDLPASPSPVSGWIRVSCYSQTMAGWLLRAVTMENVSARCDGLALDLPAAPDFRLEKEIKNVVAVIAKASHYWLGHVPRTQKQDIAVLFAAMALESPLVQPTFSDDGLNAAEGASTAARMSDVIYRDTGLTATSDPQPGWIGVACPNVRVAVWLMRAAIAYNVLSRREGTTLFVPVNSITDPEGALVVKAVSRVHRLAVARGIL